MALIKCPECGKEISDTAKFCVNCGFTVQKWLAQKAAEDAEAQRRTAREEKAAMKEAARLEKLEAETGTETKPTNRKKWFIIGGAAVLAVAAIAVVLFVFVFRQDISTFGLKYGMSMDEIVEKMEKQGFKAVNDGNGRDSWRVFAGRASLFGYQPSLISTEYMYMDEKLRICYAFLDPEYSYNSDYRDNAYRLYADLGSIGEGLYQEAVKRLGETEDHPDYALHVYKWQKDEYTYGLYDDRERHYILFDIYLSE